MSIHSAGRTVTSLKPSPKPLNGLAGWDSRSTPAIARPPHFLRPYASIRMLSSNENPSTTVRTALSSRSTHSVSSACSESWDASRVGRSPTSSPQSRPMPSLSLCRSAALRSRWRPSTMRTTSVNAISESVTSSLCSAPERSSHRYLAPSSRRALVPK